MTEANSRAALFVFSAILTAALTLAGCGGGTVRPKSTVDLNDLRARSAPPAYFLGKRYENLPLTGIVGSSSAPHFIYGTCKIRPGIDTGGCSPPLQVQNWRVSERPPSKFARDIPCRRLTLGRLPAAVFASTGGVEVYVGDRTVVIFANTETQMRRAAAALRPVKGGALPEPPGWIRKQLASRCSYGAASAPSRSGTLHPIRCRPSQLSIANGPDVSPATGQNPLSFVLTNRGAKACVLDGYPTVALLDARGKRLPFRISHGGDQMVTSRPPVAVRMLPRRSAFFVLNKYRCDLGSLKVAKTLRVGFPGVHTSARLRATLPPYGVIGYCGRGDAGSTVTVSPIEPTLAAALAH